MPAFKPSAFKPIKAPIRVPKPAPPLYPVTATTEVGARAILILRRVLRAMRWDAQGGYPGFHDGRWDFVSTTIGPVDPTELKALFDFAGVMPDEIDVVGSCGECANARVYPDGDRGERGYSAPCVSCLRPSHINHFVPRKRVTKRANTKLAARRAR